MTNLNEIATEMLKDWDYTVTPGRVKKLSSFLENYRRDQIALVENNNWAVPPKQKQSEDYTHIGGMTNKYQLWAVVYK